MAGLSNHDALRAATLSITRVSCVTSLSLKKGKVKWPATFLLVDNKGTS